MKKILWKSDLWPFTLFFGFLTLFLAGCGLVHWFVEHKPGETFGSAVAAFLPLILMLFCGFTDRSEAMGREMTFPKPPAASDLPIARAIWKESGLNPENSDRARNAMTKDPPDIG